MSPVLQAFVFGVTVALAVGPIALLILSYGVRDGFRTAFGSALGAALADLTYALLAFTIGAAAAPVLEANRTALRWVSAVVLLGFGAWLVRGALRPAREGDGHAPGAASPLAALRLTYVLTAVNPLTIVAFLAFAAGLPPVRGAPDVALRSVGLFGGSLGIQTVLAAGGGALQRVVRSPRVLSGLTVASGLGIAAFGVMEAVRLLR